MSRTTCPVYEPSLEEFRDMQGYLAKIEPEASVYGICKIRPPSGWWRTRDEIERLCDPDGPFGDCQIRNPTSQSVIAFNRGEYEVCHLVVGSKSIRELRTRAQRDSWQCFQSNDDSESMSWSGTSPTCSPAKNGIDKNRRSLGLRGDSGSINERIARRFWQSLSSEGSSTLYGADAPGVSVFAQYPLSNEQSQYMCTEWFLDTLPTDPLRLALNRAGAPRMPGVTEPMLYVGSWRAQFAWHVEDVNLYSINLLHIGAPKAWYALGQHDADRFAQFAKTRFPDAAHECPDFLQHKMSVLSPDILRNHGFHVSECIQEAGDIMLTFPAAYHCGFNHGFNVAESTNFASPRWPRFAKDVTPCACRSDAVAIRLEEISEAIETGDMDRVRPDPRARTGRSPKRKRKSNTTTPPPTASSFHTSEMDTVSKYKLPDIIPENEERHHNEHLSTTINTITPPSIPDLQTADDHDLQHLPPPLPMTTTISTTASSSRDHVKVMQQYAVSSGLEDFAASHPALPAIETSNIHNGISTMEDSSITEIILTNTNVTPSPQDNKMHRGLHSPEPEPQPIPNLSILGPHDDTFLGAPSTNDDMLCPPPIPSDEPDQPKKRRRRRARCGACPGCQAQDCGECRFCKDDVKKGGPGKLKKPCILRRCQVLHGEKATSKAKATVADTLANDPALTENMNNTTNTTETTITPLSYSEPDDCLHHDDKLAGSTDSMMFLDAVDIIVIGGDNPPF